MKKLVLSLPILFASVVAAQAVDYKIDPVHTNARFNIDHFNTSTNHGGFYGIEGDITFSEEDMSGEINVSIPVNTLNTGSKAFDGHILSADILDAEKHPTIEFKSTKLNFEDKKLATVEGNLTMKGETHPVELKAVKFNCYDNPMLKAEVCGGDFETTIDRTQWGVDYLVEQGVDKMVTLQIQVEAAKQ